MNWDNRSSLRKATSFTWLPSWASPRNRRRSFAACHLGERDCLPPSFVMACPSAYQMRSPCSTRPILPSQKEYKGLQSLLEMLPGRQLSTTSIGKSQGKGYVTRAYRVDTPRCVVFSERHCLIARDRSSAVYSWGTRSRGNSAMKTRRYSLAWLRRPPLPWRMRGSTALPRCRLRNWMRSLNTLPTGSPSSMVTERSCARTAGPGACANNFTHLLQVSKPLRLCFTRQHEAFCRARRCRIGR